LDAINIMKSREQVVGKLKDLQVKGYTHVARDEGSQYLICFSLKPKKYRDIEAWGYVNSDLSDAFMAYPIKNTDITEISWTDRSATLILDFVNKGWHYE